MKILYRQDGTRAELDDATAAKWLKRGLGTLEPSMAKAEPSDQIPTTAVKKSSFDRTTQSKGE